MVELSKSPVHLLAGLAVGRISPKSISTDQWAMLIENAQQHGLDGVLLWRLRAAGIDVSAPLFQPLVRSAKGTLARYMVFEAALREINMALAAEGIQAVWLKGAALAHTVYPEPTLRPMIDLDLLVESRDAARALAALIALGYYHEVPEVMEVHQLFDQAELHRPPQDTHHHLLIGGLTGDVVVELHFQLLVSQQFLSPEGERWFWTQTQLCSCGGFNLTIFRPEAHLLYLCIHAILHGAKADFRLSRYLDLHWLIVEETMNWQVVVERAIHLEWTQAVEQMLRQTMRYFDTPIPDHVLYQLRERRSLAEDPTRFARFYEKRTVLDTVIHELTTMSPAERWSFLRKVVLPPRAYMRNRYGVGMGQTVLPYYPYRWLVMIGKTLVGGWQLIRRQMRYRARNQQDRL